MPSCPYCGVEIIEGVDECEQCGQTLTDLSLPRPSTMVEADLLRDRIAILAPQKPTTIHPDTPVHEALSKMLLERIGCLMVVDQEKLVGIFTERDAMTKLNVDADQFSDHPISRYMTHNPVALGVQDKIAFALHKMNLGGYRHLPILDNQSLVGVISIRDILGYLYFMSECST